MGDDGSFILAIIAELEAQGSCNGCDFDLDFTNQIIVGTGGGRNLGGGKGKGKGQVRRRPGLPTEEELLEEYSEMIRMGDFGNVMGVTGLDELNPTTSLTSAPGEGKGKGGTGLSTKKSSKASSKGEKGSKESSKKSSKASSKESKGSKESTKKSSKASSKESKGSKESTKKSSKASSKESKGSKESTKGSKSGKVEKGGEENSELGM